MAWALLFSLPLCSYAQENPQWDAHWITSVTGKYYPDFQGVVMYRKTITLDEQPAAFPVKVSADNRYELFVNGQHVGRGPAYSVPQYWNYETYDLAKFLREGNNVIAARVWNYGNMGPWAQFSLRTAFIMQGNNQQSELVNTGLSWKVKHDPSRSFFKHTKEDFFHLTGVGPCEKIDAALFIDGWNDQGFDDSNWLGAEELSQGRTDAETWDEFSWRLTPSVIPQMDGSTIYLDKVVRTKGVNVPDGFVNGNNSFSIPPNTTATILFDNTTLTATYPMLEVDGGNNAEIRMIYSEALFDENNNKIHRDIAEGMTIKGYYDIFLPDGKRRIFSPLWFRTYRYLELRIETRDEPLQVIGFKGELAAYPFELKADFESSDPYLEQIFKTGWRTGRLCAFENYVDCPYYEQLQYFGDQNISNQVTLYLSGDARLMKSGILQGKYSINQEGITMCAAPNRSKNVIPFFSLAWVGIIYNYYMYTGDQEFINTLIPDIEGIIEW